MFTLEKAQEETEQKERELDNFLDDKESLEGVGDIITPKEAEADGLIKLEK